MGCKVSLIHCFYPFDFTGPKQGIYVKDPVLYVIIVSQILLCYTEYFSSLGTNQ